MQFDDFDNEDMPIVAAPPRRELLVELLKLLTPALGLLLFLLGLSSKYPWLTQPWVKECLGILGIFVVGWFARPRVVSWISRTAAKKRDRLFVATNDVRLRQFVRRFAEL